MQKLLLFLIIPLLSSAQTPITQENIQQAVDEWLADPISAEDIYGNISAWDVSNVTDMSEIFYNANSFNQDIGNWDVSNVTDMSWMFYNANSFNQDIGNWDVSNVTNMYGLFYSANFFNGDIEDWDVGNVIYMAYLFHDATSFNQDVGGWNVIKVADMTGMFYNATSFNQDIGGWNVGNVTNMGYMFRDATSFNQDIGGWNVSNVMYMGLMLHGVTLSINNYDALLCGWSQLNLIDNITFSGGDSNYCDCNEERQNIIDIFNWNIIDAGFSDNNCGETEIEEETVAKQRVKIIDIHGRETTNKGFQLEIYNDGSREKNYVMQ